MMPERVLLGHVRAPSGAIAIIDFGLMTEWSHQSEAMEAVRAGGGEIDFGAAIAVAVGGAPVQELAVWGTPMGEPPFAECWRYIDLEVQPSAAVAKRQTIGEVAVERARLMFADIDELDGWREGESFDGKADVCFWGRDEEALVQAAGAEALEDGTWGWANIDVETAERRQAELGALVRQHEWWVVGEVRPHDHHHMLMQQVRTSEHGAGELELGAAKLCGFSTSWGDGVFPVILELDAAGQWVRLRIHLGTEQAVEAMRYVNAMADDENDDSYDPLDDDDVDPEDDEEEEPDDEEDEDDD